MPVGRLALPHAQQAAEDRALLGRRGDGCRDPRVGVRPEPARSPRSNGSTPKKALGAAELPGRRRDPRALRPARRRRRAAHVPDHRAAPREGARRARSGTARTPPVRSPPRGKKQANAIVGPAARVRRAQDHLEPRRRAASRPSRRCRRHSAARSTRPPLISQDAWEEGKSDARTIVGERVRDAQAGRAVQPRPGAARDPDRDRPRDRHAPRVVPRQRLGARSRAPSRSCTCRSTTPVPGIVAIETHAPKV